MPLSGWFTAGEEDAVAGATVVGGGGVLDVADLERRHQRDELEREDLVLEQTTSCASQLGGVIAVAELERREYAESMPTMDARARLFAVAEERPGSKLGGGGAATVTAVRAGAFDVSALEKGVVAGGSSDGGDWVGSGTGAGGVFDLAALERSQGAASGGSSPVAVGGRVVGGAFAVSALEARGGGDGGGGGGRGSGGGAVFDVSELERRASAGPMPAVYARAGVFDLAELERRDSGSAATVTAVRAGAFNVSALESAAVAGALPV